MHSDVRDSSHSSSCLGDEMNDAGLYSMTEEEEAALLAEYGVAGAFDDLLSIPAASQFRSELTGSVNFFLTGAGTGEASDTTAAGLTSAEVTKEELLHDPIDALLLKYTSTLSSAAPNSVLDSVSATASSSAQRRRRSFGDVTSVHVESATSKYAAVLRTARDVEGRAFKVVSAWGPETEVSHHSPFPGGEGTATTLDSTDRLLRESEQLLSLAANVMAKPTAAEVMNDVDVKRSIAEIAESCQKETADEFDNVLAKEMSEGDEEALRLLHTAEALIAMHERERLKRGNDDKEESEEGSPPFEESAEAHRSATPALREEVEPSLFAFEMEATLEEKRELREWDAVICKQFDSGSGNAIVSTLSSPLPALERRMQKPTELLLAEMDVLEGRQAANLTAIEAHYKSRILTARADAVSRSQQRAKEGFLVLRTFSDTMEKLMPVSLKAPTSRAVAPLRAAQPSAMIGRNVAPAAAAAETAETAGTPLSVEAIAKRAARQLCLLQREALEATRMRKEDERIVRFTEARELALLEARENVESTQRSCERRVDELREEESAAFQELLASERRHRTLTHRAMRIRETKAAAALAERMTAEYESSLGVLKGEEQAAWEHVVSQVASSVAIAQEQQAARNAAEREAAIAEERSRRLCFERKRKSAQQQQQSELYRSHTSSQETLSREKLLALEKTSILQWIRAHEKSLQETKRHLKEELAAQRPRTAVPASQVTLASTNLATAASRGERANVLDEHSLPELLPQPFACAARNPQHAPQYFHTVSLAFDELEALDCDSLRRCTLPMVNAGSVTDLVRLLDLGGNRLANTLSLPALLSCFPTLEELNLSDNRLSTLTSVGSELQNAENRPSSSTSSLRLRNVMAAQRNACAERCRLRDLNLSSNSISDLSPLSEYLSSSLVSLSAVANRLTSLAGLQRCQRITTLTVNRNGIASLDDLLPLRLLQELNLCDNDIHNVRDAITRDLVVITKLFLSSNPRLSSLPSGTECFLFLQQLFLSHCGLECLTMDSLPWMPSLRVFHAEDNRLVNVSGIVKCPRLTRLNVAFNRLSTVESVTALQLCSRLESLDLRGNSDLPENASSAILSLFPCLLELNNEPVKVVRWPPAPGEKSSPSVDAFHALLCDRQIARDVTNIFGVRRVRVAEAMEQSQEEAAKVKAKDGTAAEVVGHQLSTERKLQSNRCDLQLLHDNLEELLVVAGNNPPTLRNRFVWNAAFAEKKRDALERRARATIGHFLRGCVLVGKAKAELAELRRAHYESESYRREAAARKIQPVWRGAVIRSRLTRVLKKGKDDLGYDEDEFAKVDLDFGPDDDSLLKPATIAELLKHALGYGCGEPHMAPTDAFHRFDVPATVVHPTSADSAPRSDSLALGAPSDDAAVTRAGSAPHGALKAGDYGGNGNRLVNGRLLGIGEGPLTRPSTESGAPSLSAPATQHVTPDPAWGTVVAARIDKKNKKLQRVHQDYVRSEYVRDPLNAKKMSKSAAGKKQ